MVKKRRNLGFRYSPWFGLSRFATSATLASAPGLHFSAFLAHFFYAYDAAKKFVYSVAIECGSCDICYSVHKVGSFDFQLHLREQFACANRDYRSIGQPMFILFTANPESLPALQLLHQDEVGYVGPLLLAS
jgi:hypothetical protein